MKNPQLRCNSLLRVLAFRWGASPHCERPRFVLSGFSEPPGRLSDVPVPIRWGGANKRCPSLGSQRARRTMVALPG